MAIEAFLENVAGEAANLARKNNQAKVTPSHVKHVINSKPNLAFLRPALKGIPDLQILNRPNQNTPVREVQ